MSTNGLLPTLHIRTAIEEVSAAIAGIDALHLQAGRPTLVRIRANLETSANRLSAVLEKIDYDQALPSKLRQPKESEEQIDGEAMENE